MKNRMGKSIAAIACAAVMASQMFAVTASAAVDKSQSYYYYYNGVYYSSSSDATTAAGGDASKWVSVSSAVIPDSVTEKYYDFAKKKEYSSLSAAKADGAKSPVRIYVGSYYSYYNNYYYDHYNHYGSFYSTYTGRYYGTYQAALKASKGVDSYVKYVDSEYDYYGYYGYYDYYNGYYSSYTGKYYSTYADALKASNGYSKYVTYAGRAYYDDLYGVTYRYYYNGVAYPTLSAAVSAGGTVGVNIYYSAIGSNDSAVKFYYYYKGTYYGTLEAAVKAGGTEVGVDISYVPNYFYGDPNFYGYATGYNAGYYDPYYNYANKIITASTTSTAKKAKDGEPHIYGKNTQAGWDTIIKKIKAASKGSSVKVDMNGCDVIDEDVLEALEGKDVTVYFISDSERWSINGKNITDPQEIITYVEYNIDYIPSSLVKKACKDAKAKAQLGVSASFDSLGTTAKITVKFSKKRADLKATAYRYDPVSNSLKAVSKSTVQEDGSCTFAVKEGGPYLIVLK